MSDAPEPVDEPEIVELAEQPAAVVSGTVAMSELAPFFDRAFSTLPGVLAEQGVAPTGAAFAWYDRQPTDTVDLSVGFPVARPIEASGDVRAFALPAGRVARLTHAGAYSDLGQSWMRLVEWALGQGLTPAAGFWEVYVTEPAPDIDPATLRTELNLRLR